MKKGMKILKIVGLAILVVLAIGILGFYIFGEGLIKSGVEKAASNTLGVGVSIKKVHLSLLQGKVGIEGLVVKNPQGYANENLLELGDGQVELDIGSLMSNTIRIKQIKLDGTKLTMEQKGLTNNLQEIIKRLPKEEAKPAAEEKGKNLLIDRLEITNTNVKVKLLPVPGKADTVSLNIDPIVMEKLGSDSKMSIGKLTAKILTAIATGVAKQGAGLLPDDMVKGLGSALGGVVDLGKAATREGQKVLEKGAEAGKGILEGAKGLLGGKKE
jgi:hypothetical protein